ncbi:putative protin putative armadillo repeat containing 1, partial [Schistosoma japonicum]
MKDKTTLQGLVLLLSNKNKSIVSLVLQILIIIRRRPGGDDVLRSLLGLSEQLNDLKKSTNSIDNEDDRLISNSAEELLSLFNCSTKQNSPKPIKANPEKPHSISRPKSVILQLRGLTSEWQPKNIDTFLFKYPSHKFVVCGGFPYPPNFDKEMLKIL